MTSRVHQCSLILAHWTKHVAFVNEPTQTVAALSAIPTRDTSLQTRHAATVPTTAFECCTLYVLEDPTLREDSANRVRWDSFRT